MSYIHKIIASTAVIAVAVVFLAAAPVPALTCPQVGYVTKTDGTENIFIARGKAQIPTSIATPVCTGDKLLTGKVTVLFADGDTQIYAAGKAVGRLKTYEFFGQFVKMFEELKSKVGHFVTTASRDNEPVPFEFAIAGLTEKRAKLAAGHAQIYVRWIGGVGPYDVTLTDASGAVVAQANDVTDHGVMLDARGPLRAGKWTVSVRAMFDKSITGEFDVDASKSYVPADGKQRFAEILAANNAINLATGDADWAFEADQIFAAAPAQSLDRKPVQRVIMCLSGKERPADGCQ